MSEHTKQNQQPSGSGHKQGHGHRFPFHKAEKLESDARKARQPAAPLVEVLVGLVNGARVDGGPRPCAVDVGVGTGYFALPLAQALGPDAEVVGADVEPQFLELVSGRAAELGLSERVRVAQTPADRLDLAPASADVILVAQLYHEIANRPAYLASLKRVLRPGGHLVICDWAPQDEEPAAGPPNRHRVAPAAARGELIARGFTIVDEPTLYDGFYTIIAQ